jgi:signal transduction histidine kinase
MTLPGQPRALRGGRGQGAGVAAALAVIAVLGVVEARTPQNITFGGFLLLVVLASTWLFSRLAALLVTAASLAVPIAAYAVGGDDIVASEVEILAILLLSATVHLAIASIERYEGLLAERNRQLVDVNSSLERFTADAAHEFRAPLSVVRAEVETALARAATVDDLRSHVAAIGREVDRMRRSITALLTLARADAGDLRAAFQHVDLVDLLEEVVARWQPLAAARGALVTGTLPDVGAITCDPDLIVRVVDNLVENALAALRGGGSVDVSARDDGGQWVIAVSDTGGGVDVAEASGLLEGGPDRASRRSRDSGGTGFGLALCAAIARIHGGSIGVASDGSGSVFSVRLPEGRPIMTET